KLGDRLAAEAAVEDQIDAVLRSVFVEQLRQRADAQAEELLASPLGRAQHQEIVAIRKEAAVADVEKEHVSCIAVLGQKLNQLFALVVDAALVIEQVEYSIVRKIAAVAALEIVAEGDGRCGESRIRSN